MNQTSMAFRWWQSVVKKVTGQESSFPEITTEHEQLAELGQKLHLLEFVQHPSMNTVDNIPDAVKRASHHQRMQTVFRNSRLLDTINQIDRKCGELDYAWLKGAGYLLERPYGRGFRRLSDLDLLIQKNELPRWHELFIELGFEGWEQPDNVLSSQYSSAVSSVNYEQNRRDQQILIDLHWHLIDFPARRRIGRWDFDMGPIWENRDRNLLGPEHRILYEADHAFSHSFRAWKVFIDLYYVRQNSNIDWEFLTEEAGRTRTEFSMRMFDDLWYELTGTTFLPEETRGELGENNDLERRFVSGCSRGRASIGDYLKLCVKNIPDWTKRIQFLWFIALPPFSAASSVKSDGGYLGKMKQYIHRFFRVCSNGWKILRNV